MGEGRAGRETQEQRPSGGSQSRCVFTTVVPTGLLCWTPAGRRGAWAGAGAEGRASYFT